MRSTQGGKFGGHAIHILKGKPIHAWDLLGLARVRWDSSKTLTPGRHTLFLVGSLPGVETPWEMAKEKNGDDCNQ
jgi:hypothetical protein